VTPRAGETVIEKNDASAFSTGALEPMLRVAGAVFHDTAVWIGKAAESQA
jgi:hypothetical protein